MNSGITINARKTVKFALTGIVMLTSSASAAYAQQASTQDPLRPGLDTDEATTNQTDQNTATTNTRAPVQRTNAPQPIRLLSNQPPSPDLPPPPPPLTQREANPFEPVGIRAGAFRLYPVLELTGDFSDNVRSDHTAKLKDAGLRVAPSVRLQSNWIRHSLDINVDSEHIFYKKATDIDSNTLNASSALRLDVRRGTTLLNTTTYQLSETSSASSEVPGSAIGNRSDHELSYTSALSHRFNRVVATLTGGIDWLFFDDVKLAGGGKENNADREYIEPSARLRLAYDVSPALTPFAEVAYTPRIHKKTLDRNGFARNSHGFSTSAGLGFNLSPIWGGEVALTFEHRNFDDNRLKDINTPGLAATVNWRPTRLSTVSFVSSTSIDESATTGISGTRNFDASLNISHKFRENFTGNLIFGFNYDDFVGSSDDDMYFTAQAGFAYDIHRKMQWITNYHFTRLKSGTPGNSYTENRISTGVRFRL